MKIKSKGTESILLFFIATIGLFFFGCSPRYSNVALPIDDVQEFSYNGASVVEDKWWTSFEDERLNQLIDSALQSNFDLAATWQQFLAARATVSREASNKWPQIEASAQSAVNFPENDFTGGENTQLGLSATYELDLWGRIRTAVQAEKFRAEASLFDYRTAAISLSAEIASTWYQLQAAKKQLRITENQITTNEDIITLIRSRFVGGQIRAVDILRQAQLLESTKEQQIIFSTNVRLLENQLAVLLGKQPQLDMTFENIDLPELPVLPETGLPLELVRRRPDLQRSFSILLAADRDMAAAVRSKYPRISISGRGQLRANNFDNLFENWAYSLAGNILAPLFYGKQLSAEVERSLAIKQQRLYEYGQTTLEAFQDVEDGLVRDIMQKKRLENIGRQLELAEKSNKQLRVEFLNGFSPYLDVLLGLDQEQQLRRDYVSAQSQQIQIRIGLYRALAGGFDTDRNIDY
ncbi:efflux transporter outer membrane subunit [Kriegella aquimaris]|uniref:Efflux transporter, outer membrane factor (OMF) lipoprotein, NodT family n=1 Tax=Kriegella aquimaris TaxID=192904 RepID=A0A1G9RBZ1_9FLAO|nr:efflux transporter outer membrane subunit [Kriegella aquimaris]SDM20819.1 efflux transporter, outer membrane factor (OMF) lipoprotein, NodT family [Kriegella aquimaris]